MNERAYGKNDRGGELKRVAGKQSEVTGQGWLCLCCEVNERLE
jgi:hypothetical protein